MSETKKKLTPEQEKVLLFAQRKPLPPVKIAPAKPQHSYQFRFHTYADTPGFGWQVVTINGVSVFMACNFGPDGIMHVPMQNARIAYSQEEADAIKEELKQQAMRPRLIVPGSQEWQANALQVPVKKV